MPLSDLTEHISAQAQAIRQLSSKVDSGVSSTTTWCTRWMEFRDAVLGKGLDSLQQREQVEEDDDPIEDVDLLPDQRPHTRCVATVPETLPGG
jgi:hypothetical protein